MTNEKIIWDYLCSKGLSFQAAAGIMGNLYAESALNPKNLQNTFEKSLKFTDEEYTNKVDDGTYTNFTSDSAGYGIAQWTYSTRKEKLLAFAKKQKKSIGDLNMQLDFLWQELSTNYKTSTLTPIKKAATVQEASNIFLTQYERPADQSTDVKTRRGNYAQGYFNKYATTLPNTLPPTDTLPPVEQLVTYIQNFSNSDLVEVALLSPNITKDRNHVIDTITIHVLVGQATVENALEWFSRPTTQASCNYVVDKDGRIGLCCEEKDRSWCTSSRSNDHRAITIEVASDKTHPYAVNDKAYESLIKLVADICIRNNIKELKWKADKNLIGNVKEQNMTVHRWFANKSCPGEYLYSRHSEIASRVNKLINGEKDQPTLPSTLPPYPNTLPPTPTVVWYRIRKSWEDSKSQIGAYESLTKAKNACDKAGAEYNVYDMDGKKIYPEEYEEETPTFKIGDKVKVIAGAKYTSGANIPDWVIKKEFLYVRKINTNGTYVISTVATGAVTGTVPANALTLYVPEDASAKTYIVRITAAALNVRQGPGTIYKINTQVQKNELYTIVEEKNNWGRLKNGAGWISLAYTKKV